MARSLKKGPFADASVLKKVDAMNAQRSWKRRKEIESKVTTCPPADMWKNASHSSQNVLRREWKEEQENGKRT